MFDELRDEASSVILEIGDLIVDIRTGAKGFLTERERRIDIVEDDIYIWKIMWFYKSEKYDNFNTLPFMEEEGLKLSVMLGQEGKVPISDIQRRHKGSLFF